MEFQGYCPICEKESQFVAYGPWFRDTLICRVCQTTPRFRSFAHVLRSSFPNYTELRIHESSPTQLTSCIWRNCRDYSASHFYPDGQDHDFQHQNLQAMRFPDEVFDLFVTMDVFEHIPEPEKAFREIARVLKPGGAHIFSIPLYWQMTTTSRKDKESVYHQNPIDPKGSLVTIDYGRDVAEYIFKASGMFTTIYSIQDREKGILGEMTEVLVSRKF